MRRPAIFFAGVLLVAAGVALGLADAAAALNTGTR